MSVSKENMLRAKRDLDIAKRAYRAGRIETDPRLAAAEKSFKKARLTHRSIQVGVLIAELAFAVGCGAFGVEFGMPAWAVAAMFLAGVAAIWSLAVL